MIDWWDGPLAVVVFLFALCLLLLPWSIAGVACRACHSFGTFSSLWHNARPCHVGLGRSANLLVHVWVSMRACRQFFLLFLLFLCTYVCESAFVCHGSYFEMFDTLGSHFKMFDSQHHFPSYSSLLSVLAPRSTVNLRVYSCLDLGPETGRLQHV